VALSADIGARDAAGAKGHLAAFVGELDRIGEQVAEDLRDLARGREHALEAAVTVVKGGRVVGHDGEMAVPGAGRGLEVVTVPSPSTRLMPASARSGSVK
jgi:hypothetical protein